MVPVVIQDFSRQRRALDDGDFSKYCWSFPVAEAACDKQSFVFLSMHFHHLLYCYCSCFNFQSTKCDFAPVLSEVNSEERCVIRWPWWLLCESVFILEIQVSLAPDCTVLITPSYSSLIHPMRNYPQSMVSWLYSTVCTVAYILFCLDVVTNVLFFSPPPHPDTMSEYFSNSWSQSCSLHCHLYIPAPVSHWCTFGIPKSDLLFPPPHYIQVMHWTLINGRGRYIIQHVDLCL